jgi:hypothetical protein
VSKAARDEEAGERFEGERDWQLGTTQRHRGSIHSDVWRGSAAELANRDHVAVYPVTGWWKERGRLDEAVRYSLVVSISTPETEVDLYTPVRVQVQVPTLIAT